MKKALGVRFVRNGPIFYYEDESNMFTVDDKVIIKQGEYLEIGRVVIASKECQKEDLLEPARLIERLATPDDLVKEQKNTADATEAFQIGKKEARKAKLEMKIIGASYSFDRQKLTFLFSAPGRVDFRSLVRELAAIFKVRIELRQIGARDEAKYLGGIGPCGRPLCCSTFLGDFVPVSIKMAKNQGLSLNSNKLSGLCGRLMCCLNFENETYEELKKSMPDYGEEITTPEGHGKVVGLDILSQVITVKLFEERKTVDYAWEELTAAWA
ncbi:stage 0 sporulation family protein [Jeotgalibaca porci]|uniref:PSP1 domain-containing protein n=1 Tax=Jeotgalibaca porci TaxID=1868793 RepID=UPI0016AD3E87|nr:stage 0 sporulation family protein [Lactobacillales bacterium]